MSSSRWFANWIKIFVKVEDRWKQCVEIKEMSQKQRARETAIIPLHFSLSLVLFFDNFTGNLKSPRGSRSAPDPMSSHYHLKTPTSLSNPRWGKKLPFQLFGNFLPPPPPPPPPYFQFCRCKLSFRHPFGFWLFPFVFLVTITTTHSFLFQL